MNYFADEPDYVQDHVHSITDRELDLLILKIGSFVSIAYNKKINQAKLLILLVKNQAFRDDVLKILEVDNFQFLVQCLMEKYPTLCKSKIVIGALKRDYGLRKKDI